MNMNAAAILNIVNYSIAALISCAGIGVLAGLLLPTYVPENIRTILGIMFILYGLFRGATTWMKQQQVKRIAERYNRDEQ